MQNQPQGVSGPLVGDFVILDTGDNKHSEVLRELLDYVTNAPKVLRMLRQDGSSCVSVANTNILTVEEGAAAAN